MQVGLVVVRGVLLVSSALRLRLGSLPLMSVRRHVVARREAIYFFPSITDSTKSSSSAGQHIITIGNRDSPMIIAISES
jgi:hypothetical protein